MKVVGFTFIRNAIKYDYPIIEAISSILPLCHEVIVAVGNSEDNTLELIKNIDKDKITILPTIWDDNLRFNGQVLAEETNKAFRAISKKYDWAFYIQGDEVLHEKYLPILRKEMFKWKDDIKVDGLLFNYLHFYASFDYIASTYNWYKKEIRIIKNNKAIYSYKDAQGFRKENNKKLKVKLIDAYIYHYGWVKMPKLMQEKQLNFNKYWHDDKWIENNIQKGDVFDYFQIVNVLKKFQGTHPKYMQKRIRDKNWTFEYDLSFNKYSYKDKIKLFFEKYFNYIPWEYRNYKII